MGADSWIEGGRKKWRVRNCDDSPLACHKLLIEETDNLAGIFCGHIHFSHTDQLHPGGYQYVTRPCFEGEYRVIKLRSLD